MYVLLIGLFFNEWGAYSKSDHSESIYYYSIRTSNP